MSAGSKIESNAPERRDFQGCNYEKDTDLRLKTDKNSIDASSDTWSKDPKATNEPKQLFSEITWPATEDHCRLVTLDI